MATHCEFRKPYRMVLGGGNGHPSAPGVLYRCTANNLRCMVDDGGPAGCIRFAWIKQVQSKTAKIAQLSAELQALGKAPYGYVGGDARP